MCCLKGLPSPARLIFTPEPASLNCLNCESVMTPNHQCEELISSSVAPVNCGSEPPAHSKSLGAFSESELSDDSTPPGSPVVLKRIIRPRKFCDLWYSGLSWYICAVFPHIGVFSPVAFLHYSSRCIVLQINIIIGVIFSFAKSFHNKTFCIIINSTNI